MPWNGFPPDPGRQGIYVLSNGLSEMRFAWEPEPEAWILLDDEDPGDPIEPHEIAAADMRLIREA